MNFWSSSHILFHCTATTISTMCTLGSINSFWVACSMCLHFINVITSTCPQFPCLYRVASCFVFANLLLLLLAFLLPISPLPTPFPPIYWRHCCNIYKHWQRVVHLHSKGSSAALGKAPKDTTEKCWACYNWRCFSIEVPSWSLKISSMMITYFPRVCGDFTFSDKGKIFKFGIFINL